MALTDRQLEYISDALVPLFQYLEEQVIIDVAKRIKDTLAYSRTAELEAESLQRLGYSPAKIRRAAMKILRADKEFQKAVAKNTIEHRKKVRELLQEITKDALDTSEDLIDFAARASQIDDLRIWKEHGKEISDESFLPQLVDAFKTQTQDTLKNLTGTTGFKTMSGFESMEDLYRRELDKAMIKICTGTFSREVVIYETIRSLAKSGLRTIDFNTGRSMQLDTAVKLAVRTGAHQISGKIMDANIERTGVCLVYVSKHWGARNKGTGHKNHQEWQGKVYRVSSEDYEDYTDESIRVGQESIEPLWEATGYNINTSFEEDDYLLDGDSRENDPNGLYGYNCRHRHYPWFLGSSEMPEEDPEPQPVTIDGKTYDYYAITQKMRYMERKIRAMKREREALKALRQDTATISKDIKQKIRDYKDFCKSAKVNPDINRLTYECGTSDLTKTTTWKRYGDITSEIDE